MRTTSRPTPEYSRIPKIPPSPGWAKPNTAGSPTSTLPSGFGSTPTRLVGEGFVGGAGLVVVAGRLGAADTVGEPAAAGDPADGTEPQATTMTRRTVMATYDRTGIVMLPRFAPVAHTRSDAGARPRFQSRRFESNGPRRHLYGRRAQYASAAEGISWTERWSSRHSEATRMRTTRSPAPRRRACTASPIASFGTSTRPRT